MRVRIHPAAGYAANHAASVLRVLGAQNIALNEEDGTCVADVSESDLQKFALRGGSHRVERLEDPITQSVSGGITFTPESLAAYFHIPVRIAQDLLERKALIDGGMTADEAEDTILQGRLSASFSGALHCPLCSKGFAVTADLDFGNEDTAFVTCRDCDASIALMKHEDGTIYVAGATPAGAGS